MKILSYTVRITIVNNENGHEIDAESSNLTEKTAEKILNDFTATAPRVFPMPKFDDIRSKKKE